MHDKFKLVHQQRKLSAQSTKKEIGFMVTEKFKVFHRISQSCLRRSMYAGLRPINEPSPNNSPDWFLTMQVNQ